MCQLRYPNDQSLNPVRLAISEARSFVNNPEEQMSNMTEEAQQFLGFFAGAGAGAGVSLVALYSAGITGLSAAGITSGLAAIGGSMVAGIGVLALPVVALGVGGYLLAKALGSASEDLNTVKRRLLADCRRLLPLVQNYDVDSQPENVRDMSQLISRALEGAINDLVHDLTVVI